MWVVILAILMFGGIGNPQNQPIGETHLEYSLKADSLDMYEVGSWPFSASFAVTIDTERYLAFLGSGAGVYILDISDSSNPVLISDKIRTPGRVVRGLYYESGHQRLYAAVPEEGLEIWDVSDPADPQKLGYLLIPGIPLNVFVQGNYAYVADSIRHLRIINVENPSNPYEVGSFWVNEYVRDVYVSGSYAYIVTQYGLRILDVSDPANPQQVGVCDTTLLAWSWSLYVRGNYAFVACHRGLVVIDVSDPSNPQVQSNCSNCLCFWSHDIYVKGNYAYLGDSDWYNHGLTTIDISDPSNPEFLRFFHMPGMAHNVFVFGDLIYVATDSAGLKILNVNSPAHPHYVGSFDVPGHKFDIQVQGNYAYLADGYAGLHIIDVSNPEYPTPVGHSDIDGKAWSLYVAGNNVYFADSVGLKIVDVSDPSNPSVIGSCETPGIGRNVYVSDNVAYIADGSGGLRIVDVSDPTNPVEIGHFDTPDYVRDVFVSDSLAYVVDNGRGLRIIDVSDPANPMEIGSCDIPGWAFKIFVDGDYAYIASRWEGLEIVDVSDPANPRLVGEFNISEGIAGIHKVWKYAYIASEGNGIHVIDVSDPTNPVEVNYYDTPGYAHNIFVRDNYVYVADHYGLRIYSFVRPPAPILILPRNSEIFVDTTISFSWSAPDWFSGTFAFQIATDSSFNFVVVNQAGLADTFFECSLTDSTYWWRVKAIDTTGNESNWSRPGKFIIDTHSPDIPYPLSPVGGEWLNSQNVVFQWTEVQKLERLRKREKLSFRKIQGNFKSAPVHYVLEILSGDSTVLIDTVDTNCYTVSLQESAYKWRVKAFDDAGNISDWSPLDSFGIDLTAPILPVLIHPSEGFVASSDTLRFIWSSGIDTLSGVRDYAIMVDSNLVSSADTTILYVIHDEGVHTWKVKVFDNAGNSATTSQVNFLIDRTPPSIDSFTIWTDTSQFYGPYPVNAWVSDTLSGVDSVWICYSIDGSQFDSVAMEFTNGHWYGEIPAFSDSATHSILYFIRATDVATPPNIRQSEVVTFTMVGIYERHEVLPAHFEVFGIAPNPSSGKRTLLKLALPADCSVAIAIYDVSGRLVKSFFVTLKAGYKNIPLVLPQKSGVYIMNVKTIFGEKVVKLIVTDF